LGAPGDRRAENGTLWLDYPSVGGPSPQVAVQVGGSPKYFRHHAMRISGDLAWVAASGVEGAKTITIQLNGAASGKDGDGGDAKRPPQDAGPLTPDPSPTRGEAGPVVQPSSTAPTYKVRLVFAEPDENARPGDRVFDVALEGKTVLKGFDIVAATGGPLRSVVKEFTAVAAGGELKIELTSQASRPALLCGVEAVEVK
jgi:hypothetical protein